jgi:hypothetical protein
LRWSGHVVRMRRRGMHQDISGKARKKEPTRKNKT